LGLICPRFIEWSGVILSKIYTKQNPQKTQIMKQIAKAVLKALLVVILFTGGSVGLSTMGVKTVSEANAATYNQVYEYLCTNGYVVITLERKDGTKYDWIAHTIRGQVHFATTIYCDQTCIIAHGDVPM
jgi:UDP-N-acetylglucosamine:LPS N-acetylglucosamine transferase